MLNRCPAAKDPRNETRNYLVGFKEWCHVEEGLLQGRRGPAADAHAPWGLTVLKLGKRLSGDVPLSLKVRKCLMSKGG